jgi:guanine deaminase
MTVRRIIRGRTLNFTAEGPPLVHDRGAVAVSQGGRILWSGDWSLLPREFAETPIDDYQGCLVLPGFIDPHVHFPQHRMLAAPAGDLLEWLNRYTFPEEARFGDKIHVEEAAKAFLARLFAAGTTSILAFCSIHKLCADLLFTAAEAHGMGIITGKTMMDRNAIPALHESPEKSASESEDLLRKWHSRGRARYAISPRFAITSSEAQLKLAGELLHNNPGAYLQTHLSESQVEIEAVRRLYPAFSDYTAVYEKFGLLGERSFFAHGVHLSESECRRLHDSKSKVVHCPTSNTFLGSGLFSFAHLQNPERPVPVGLATDIGGGTSYSMLSTMAEAYKVAMLRGIRLKAVDLFRMATRGNATLLGLEGETGSLDQDAFADVIVLDPEATPVLAARQQLSRSIEEVLFALMILGDDRAVKATYVAGRLVHARKAIHG